MADATVEADDRIIIIIIGTEAGFRLLAKSTVWYGDGTLSIAPVHFYQLYTIHGIVLGQLLPLVYCLMTKKSKSTYELLFETFKDVAQVRKGNERILRVVQSYGDRDNMDYHKLLTLKHLKCHVTDK